MLAKALAHYFEAKLLLLDITDFSLKVCMPTFYFSLIFVYLFLLALISIMFEFIQIQSKYGSGNKESVSFLLFSLEFSSSIFNNLIG